MENLQSYYVFTKNKLIQKLGVFGLNTRIESNKLVNSWLGVLPILENHGFEITSFAVGYSFSPFIEIELRGRVDQFPLEKIDEILENDPSPGIKTVFNALRGTLVLYNKFDSTPQNDLLLKIKVGLSPEIRIFIGEPVIA